MTQKIKIEIEYNVKNRTAELLNTGEVLPFSEEKVYTVFLDKNFKINKFVALDTNDKLDMHPKLIDCFKRALIKKSELLEKKN